MAFNIIYLSAIEFDENKKTYKSVIFQATYHIHHYVMFFITIQLIIIINCE
jgi:hypothetical protein